ncbi:PIN domain-containing protein [bacterium]|nr:PIN domain-containing protein [bacterium]MBU1753414.1 PIN domain-containing protein [bacterium]
MNILDANILIRYFVEDDKDKADRCEKLFEKAIKGEVDLYILDIVIAEIIWVMDSFYKLNRLKIKECLMKVINTPHINFQNRYIILDAVNTYADKNVDFIDAYQAAFMKNKNIKTVFSYDTDFDKLSGIEREEP